MELSNAHTLQTALVRLCDVRMMVREAKPGNILVEKLMKGTELELADGQRSVRILCFERCVDEVMQYFETIPQTRSGIALLKCCIGGNA